MYAEACAPGKRATSLLEVFLSSDERSPQQLFSIQAMLFSLHRGFTVYAIELGNTESEQNPSEDR